MPGMGESSHDLKIMSARVHGRYTGVQTFIPRLRRIAEAYRENMQRVAAMLDLPTDASTGLLVSQRHKREGDVFTLTDNDFIQLNADVRQLVEQLAQPGYRTRGGLEMLLASTLIATWTAFESLATDLWVEAVNRR